MNVIISEGLYDKDFVRDWVVGFDEFVERLREYPLERVAKITGCNAELIAKAARMYATSGPACIPWTPVTDQQVSSTSAIRLQCMLRALCGHLDVKGGDTFLGFNPAVRSDSEMEMHEALSPQQKAKQLGSEQFPVFTYIVAWKRITARRNASGAPAMPISSAVVTWPIRWRCSRRWRKVIRIPSEH